MSRVTAARRGLFRRWESLRHTLIDTPFESQQPLVNTIAKVMENLLCERFWRQKTAASVHASRNVSMSPMTPAPATGCSTSPSSVRIFSSGGPSEQAASLPAHFVGRHTAGAAPTKSLAPGIYQWSRLTATWGETEPRDGQSPGRCCCAGHYGERTTTETPRGLAKKADAEAEKSGFRRLLKGPTMARWFVIRGGSEHGPLSDAELKSAAAAGKIRPDDAVRREDGKVSRPARELKGLTFPPDLNSRLLTADDDFDSIDPFNLKAASPETGIAACLAQKEKIRNTLLPRAYVALGKKYFEAVDHSPTGQPPPPEVAPFVEQIDTLLLNAPTPSRPGTQSTTDPARERAVEHQLAKKYAQLGKRAYDVGKLPPSFLAEHNAIQDLLQRDKLLTNQVDLLRVEAKRNREADELAAQLRRAKQTAVAVADTMKGAGESLMYSTPVLVVLATLVPPVGLWLIWQHPTWGIKSKIRWTGLSVAVFLSLIMANQVRTAFLTATEASVNAKNWAVEQLTIATGTAPSPATPAPQAAPQPQPAAVGQNRPAADERRAVDNGEEMEMATWSPDGTKIATASKQKIRIWDSGTLKLQQELSRAPSEGFPECLFTADDGSRLITPSDNGVLQLWDVPSKRVIKTTRASAKILGMSRSTLANTFLVRLPQNRLEVYQTTDLKQESSFQLPYQLQLWSPLTSFPTRNWHAMIREESEVLVINAGEIQTVKRLRPPCSLDAQTLGIGVSRDGRKLAVGSDTGSVVVYNTITWSTLWQDFLETSPAYCVAFSDDGKLLVSGNVDGALRVWDADSGKLLKTHRPGTGQISSVSFSPDGRALAFTEIRGGQKLFVWNASTLLD